MKQKKLVTAVALMGSMLLLAGCDDGDDVDLQIGSDPAPTNPNDNGSPTDNGSAETTGVLFDEPVEGVEFSAGGTTGITNVNGEFTVPAGEDVTFSIDGVELGVADTDELGVSTVITPRELADNDDEAAVNITQFLQSVDDDRDPSNGINVANVDITDGLVAALETALFGALQEFVDTVTANVITEITEANSTPGALVTRAQAEDALQNARTERASRPAGGPLTAPDNCPSFASGIVRDGRSLCSIDGTDAIEEDITLTSDIDWFLDGAVRIGTGDVELDNQEAVDNLPNPTLTIEPATDIFASGSSLLKITRGATIDARGTRTSPITFSGVDQGLEGSGEWGAVIVQGFGIANPDPDSDVPNVDLEAGLGFYGGLDNTDSSGTIEFVRIVEGGNEVAPDEEINGLTLAGVGSGTTINHLQVQGGLDDGIEWFGGAVNVKNYVLTSLEDDNMDFDLGWQGNAQFGIIIQRDIGDRGIESDNNGNLLNALPRTRPTIANVTFVGIPGGDGAMHREGMGGFIHNSIFTGFGTCLISEDDTEVAVSTPRELVYNNVIHDCVDNSVGAIDGTDNLVANELFNADQPADRIIEASVTLDDDFIPTFDIPTGADFTLDPAGGGEIADSVNTADTDFLEATDYVGAVNPNGEDLWFEGWTIPGTLSLDQ